MKKNTNILILGALGQIGSALTKQLREIYGANSIIASDIRLDNDKILSDGPFQIIDATDYNQILECVKKHSIHTVYLMAAMLSANAEKHPNKAWHLNMSSLFHVLNLAKEGYIKKIFWPSSIAVFGPTTPKYNVPQQTLMTPNTAYGLSKLAGEGWCAYYHDKYGIDVRSLRYPGIVSWQSMPGGGTTDYAVDIFHKAVFKEKFICFLKPDTLLPMMYMEDALRATLKIMDSEVSQISVRTSYNISGMSFTPEQLFNSIRNYCPEFLIEYQPDFRQSIAEGWPGTIDDSKARQDWGWKPSYNLVQMTQEMIKNLKDC